MAKKKLMFCFPRQLLFSGYQKKFNADKKTWTATTATAKKKLKNNSDRD